MQVAFIQRPQESIRQESTSSPKPYQIPVPVSRKFTESKHSLTAYSKFDFRIQLSSISSPPQLQNQMNKRIYLLNSEFTHHTAKFYQDKFIRTNSVKDSYENEIKKHSENEKHKHRNYIQTI